MKHLWDSMDICRVGDPTLVGEEHGIGPHRNGNGFTDIFTANHLKGDVVKEVSESIRVIVQRSLLKNLLARRTFHIKGIRNATTFNMNGETHVGALGCLYGFVGKDYREGEGLLKFLVVTKDALRGLNRKTRKKDDQGHQNRQQNQKKVEITKVAFQIDGIRKTKRGKLLGALFDGRGKKLGRLGFRRFG